MKTIEIDLEVFCGGTNAESSSYAYLGDTNNEFYTYEVRSTRARHGYMLAEACEATVCKRVDTGSQKCHACKCTTVRTRLVAGIHKNGLRKLLVIFPRLCGRFVIRDFELSLANLPDNFGRVFIVHRAPD